MINSPSRLHFGFLDPNASVGRRYSSLGLSISNFDTKLLTNASNSSAVFGKASNSEIQKTIFSLIKKLQIHFKCSKGLAVEVISIPPRHCGFGTGTQLGLSIAKSFCTHYSLPFDIDGLSAILGRGSRSGIGAASFQSGGFIVDGGKVNNNIPPPLLVQKKFPESWKILLVLDNSKIGLHGNDEKEAIKRLPKFEKTISSHLCHETLLRILPAIVEKDFNSFAIGLNEIQKIMGNYFSPAQGGSNFLSKEVEIVMDWLIKNYNVAYGQSSWGPTGFAVFENQALLLTVLDIIKKERLISNSMSAVICQASNVGASLKKLNDT